MINTSDLDPLIELVVANQKPGAIAMVPLTDEYAGMMACKDAGLDYARRIDFRTSTEFILAKKRLLTRDVIEDSGVIDELSDLVDLRAMAYDLGRHSVAQGLASLGRVGKRREADADAIEGVLLGYANCDIRYYLGVTHFEETPDPASLELQSQPKPDSWPDVHLLCGNCAVEKLVEINRLTV